MVFILVSGLVAGVILGVLYLLVKFIPKIFDKTIIVGLLLALAMIIIAVGFGMGLWSDVAGYEPTRMISLTQLCTLNCEPKNMVYVREHLATKTYDYCVQSQDPNNPHTEKTLGYDNIKIVRDNKYTDSPRLVVYEQKAKKSFWTFALRIKKTEYVFYIPENGVIISPRT